MDFSDVSELRKIGVIPQRQKDYYVLRIKVVAGDLGVDDLKAIARVAEEYGKGKVHLSTRQGVEIHNIHVSKVVEARTELAKAGIELGACGPRVRGIMACPGAGTCRHGIIETKALAGVLDRRYFRQGSPGKFKIAVSGCPNDCSKPVENDVGIMGGVLPKWDGEKCIDCSLCVNICPTAAITDHGEGQYLLCEEKCILCGICITDCPSDAWEEEKKGYTLLLGGTMGKRPRLGTRVKTLIQSEDELLRYVDRALAFYRAHGRKKERFGHTMERIGVEKTLQEVLDGD